MDPLSHTNWADEVEEEEEQASLEQAAQNTAHILEVQTATQPSSKPKPSSAQPYVPPAHRSGRDTPPQVHAHALPRDGPRNEASRPPGPAPAVTSAKPSTRQNDGGEQAGHAELLQQMHSMLLNHEQQVMAKVQSKLSSWQDELTQRVTQSVLQQVMVQMQSHLKELHQAAPAGEKQASLGQQESSSAAEAAIVAPQLNDRVSVFERLGAGAVGPAPQESTRCSPVGEARAGDSREEDADGSDPRMKNRPSRATRAGFTVYTPPSRQAPGSHRVEEAGDSSRHQYEHHAPSHPAPHPYDRAVGNGQGQGPARNSRHVTR